MEKKKSTKSKGSAQMFGKLNMAYLEPCIPISYTTLYRRTIKIVGLNGESDQELLTMFFSFCKEYNFKPNTVEFGAVVFKTDKPKKYKAFNVLKGIMIGEFVKGG